MNLVVKCVTACAIMIGIDLLSRTPNYFVSALLLSFPGLSITAYWFMCRELGAAKVIETMRFGIGAGAAFCVFLLAASQLLKRWGPAAALTGATVVWLVLAGGWTAVWKLWLGH